MSSKFHIGQRLSFSGALCTVRYAGPVRRTNGDWLGVEWDDPSRGKHTGEHEGVRYFECRRKSPTAGSFVRPSRPVDQPVGFLQALQSKYASETLNSGTLDLDGKSAETIIEIGGKVVEEVGFEKIRKQLSRLYELQIVLLDGLCIAGVLPDTAVQPTDTWLDKLKCIERTCPKVTELDLSRNLVETWDEVADICVALPKLRSLRISGNRFNEISLVDDRRISGWQSRPPCEDVQELGLDDTLLSWEDVVALASRFPSLTTLSASCNEFSRIASPLHSDTLVSLTLEQNAFSSLGSLSPLTELPNLKSLFLRDNIIDRIEDLHHSTSDDTTSHKLQFSQNLEYIDLSFNVIAKWSFIDNLQDVFPGLTGLRVSHNPLYENPAQNDGKIMGVDEGYMLTLARLANLKNLNFSTISKQERTNAEIYYLSRIAKCMAAVPETEEQKITSQHPRYAELCETHGAPTVIRKASSATDPNSIAARLITFTLSYTHPAPDDTSSKPITHIKEIPRSFDIYRLKGVIGRLLGQKPMSLKLIWETGELDPVPGYEEGWDSSDEDGDEEGENGPSSGNRDVLTSPEELVHTGKWVMREVELVDSTREVGFWIEKREARVRVELRRR